MDDWVLVNDDGMISDIQHCDPIGKSDHSVLVFKLYVPMVKEKDSRKYMYNLKKGNYEKMRQSMEIVDWDKVSKNDVEEYWNKLKDIIHECMNECIPKIKIDNKQKVKPTWMCHKTIRKIKKKYKLFKRFLCTRSGQDYSSYIVTRNECCKLIKESRKEYEKQVATEAKTNPKKFWKYVNERMKVTQGISTLKKENGNMAESDLDKAETLNNFFSSVFTREKIDTVPNMVEGQNSDGIFLSDLRLTPVAVERKLKDLNPNKAQGPDQIPPKVLKELSKELSNPLCMLYNMSLESGVIPKDWKKAEVSAIFKKGAKSDPGNYRPVSLTCIACKVLESLIRDQIVSHFEENKLYTSCQHGFRQRRSCATQLMGVVEQFLHWLDEGKPFDVVYLDFSKAFDSVPHERLLKKLSSYGIIGNILRWTECFLSGRTQRVRVGSSFSSEKAVLSGIPQGSILGPVLFTIFINDLPDGIESFCQIFADDTKIYNIASEHNVIQKDLQTLQEWTDTWELHFNVLKCKVMQVGKKNPGHRYLMKIKEDNKEIDVCEREKDLGVIFDKNMSFDNHIENAVSKANRMIGIIRRSFSQLNKEIFLKLYKALIRPHVEYANNIWYPFLKRQSVLLEKVQRRATRLVPECKNMEYVDRLKYLNIYSLKGRRIRGDLIEAYKIINGIVDIDVNKVLSLATCSRLRYPEKKILIEYCKTERRKFSFRHRVAKYWNSLSPLLKNANNTNMFKNLLDKSPKFENIFFDFD